MRLCVVTLAYRHREGGIPSSTLSRSSFEWSLPIGLGHKSDTGEAGLRSQRHDFRNRFVFGMPVGADMQLRLRLLFCGLGKTRRELIHRNPLAVPVEIAVFTDAEFDMIRLGDIGCAACLGQVDLDRVG